MASILVVGGAGGLGSALVAKLVARGDRIAVTVLNDGEAVQVASAYADRVTVHRVDLGDPEAALANLRTLVNGIPVLDAVVVCAGISPYGPVELTPLAVFEKVFRINCLANVAVYQAAIAALRQSKGRIVFTSSMAGRAAIPFVGAYVASKYALEGVGDVMRREAQGQGVAITLVEPGGIRTAMVDQQLATVKGRLAELALEDRQRYGHLYRRFDAIASESQRTTASTADQVADVVLQALDAPEPETRYIAGGDAQQMLGMADVMSDRELDGLFDQMFSEAADK